MSNNDTNTIRNYEIGLVVLGKIVINDLFYLSKKFPNHLYGF